MNETFFRAIIDSVGVLFEIMTVIACNNVIWSRPNNSIKKFLLMLTVPSIIMIAVMILANNGLIILLTGVAAIFYVTSFYRVKFIQNLFTTLLLSFTFIGFEVITGILISIFTNIPVDVHQQNIWLYLEGVLISKIGVFTCIKLISLLKSKKVYHISTKVVAALMLVPIASIFAIYIIAAANMSYSPSNGVVAASILAVALLMASNIFTFYVFERQTEVELTKQKLQHFENLNKVQISHYAELYASQKELRKIRHDISNNLIALSGYLHNGNTGKAAEYIDSLTTKFKTITATVDTGHPTVDAIIKAKLEKAEANGTQLIYKIQYSNDDKIDEMDMAIIIGNALDNAIEACSLLEDKAKRRIILNIYERGSFISILMENPVVEDFDPTNIKTSKADSENHGIGLRTIRSMAEKYAGDVEIKVKEKMFKISIMLQKT